MERRSNITQPPVVNTFTIDVEGWYNILDLAQGPRREDWGRYEDRESHHTLRLLDLLDRHGVKATCFVLGWTAEHRPKLIKEIAARGHEIACHGYGHDLLYRLTPDRFLQDLQQARAAIGASCGEPIRGYRVPGFSLTEQTPWAWEALADEGFDYDSSVFPGSRGHGGMPSAPRLPHIVELADGRRLREFPISMVRLLGQPTAYAGGGYLRLFPYALIRRWIRRANQAGEPVVVYIHPRDIDPDQPRLPMPLHRRFKSYVNLHTAMGKLDRLLRDFSWEPMVRVLDRILPTDRSPEGVTTVRAAALKETSDR